MLYIDITGEILDRGTIEQLVELLGNEELTIRNNGYVIKRITTDADTDNNTND